MAPLAPLVPPPMLLDAFQSPFKDNYQFIAGVYFLYRVVALTAFVFTTGLLSYYVTMEVLLACMQCDLSRPCMQFRPAPLRHQHFSAHWNSVKLIFHFMHPNVCLACRHSVNTSRCHHQHQKYQTSMCQVRGNLK